MSGLAPFSCGHSSRLRCGEQERMENASAENMEEGVRVASERVSNETECGGDDEADGHAQVAPVLPPDQRGRVHESGNGEVALISRWNYVRAPLLLDGKTIE